MKEEDKDNKVFKDSLDHLVQWDYQEERVNVECSETRVTKETL